MSRINIDKECKRFNNLSEDDKNLRYANIYYELLMLRSQAEQYYKHRQHLDEIEEIVKVNAINTCWNALNLCDKCDEKEECGLQSPLAKLHAISNIIKQAKEENNENH